MTLRYRLVAIDIDGTLLDQEGRIRPAVARAVRRAADAGVTVVLATGRRYRRTLPFMHELGLSTYAICQHGTVVRAVGDGSVRERSPLDLQTALDIGRKLEEMALEPIYFVDGYDEGVDFILTAEPALPGTVEYASKHMDTWRLGEAELAKWPVLVVSARDEWSRLEAAQAAVCAGWGGRTQSHILKIVEYVYPGFEVLSADAGKGTALLALARRLGIPREATAAIGDGSNDVDMIEKAGLGIAMGNAGEPLRRAADVVVASNESEGVAEALDLIMRA